MRRYKIIAINEKQILIIEDDEGNLNLFTKILKQKWPHANVRTSTTLKEASVAIAERAYALIIADIGMPDGDTLGLLNTKHEIGTKPILVVTGNLNITEDEIWERGGLGLVRKPIIKKETLISECIRTMQIFKPIKHAFEQTLIADAKTQLAERQTRTLEGQARTLKCYDEISKLFGNEDMSLQDTIDRLIEIIHLIGCENPDQLSISIKINGASARTNNFRETENRVIYPIEINNSSTKGNITVYAHDPNVSDPKMAFPKEFLKNVSVRVAYLYERSEAKKIIAENTSLLTAIFEKSENPKVIINENGQVIKANRAADKFTGIGLDEMIGTRFIDLNWSMIESQQKLLEESMDRALTGDSSRFDYYCQSSQNVCTHFTTSITPIQLANSKAMILEATDNTAYKNLLHEIMKHHKMVLGSSDAYVSMDMKGNLSPVNPAWETITGYPLSTIEKQYDVSGEVKKIDQEIKREFTSTDFECLNPMKIGDLLTEESEKKFNREISILFRSRIDGNKAVELGDYELIAEDGSSRYVSITCMTNTREKRLTGYILNLHDNTELQKLAKKDPLTGLNNRRAGNDRIQIELNKAERDNRNIGIIMMDLDYFKQVNDTYGHKAGDEVLRRTAAIIQECIRKGDIAARWGGEEFLCVLPEADKEVLLTVAERIRGKIEEAIIEYDGKVIPVKVSLGVSLLNEAKIDPRDEKAGEDLIHIADTALYESKENGRNRVTFLIQADTK